MNKAKKYKLKLDYTEDELKELKELRKDYKSPINAIHQIIIVASCDDPLRNLRAKYFAIGHEDEFDFMADVNNVVMGTAIFPEKKYVVHDKVTDQYIYYNATEWSLRWGRFDVAIPDIGIPDEKTKDEWLAISPAYEPMLESVEDDE